MIPVTSTPKLVDTVRSYYISRKNGTERVYVINLNQKIKEVMKSNRIDSKCESVRELVFLNLLGYDTSWADMDVLDVMAEGDFSAKKVAYTAAGQMWNSESPVVLMSTNRIQKDLSSLNPYYSSFVLSSFSPYLTKSLAQNIQNEVISLMSSSNTIVRQRAMIGFYQLCLKYPPALKAGFPVLRTSLNDNDFSIIFTALTVMTEFCTHNPGNFVCLIPQLFKMLTSISSNWMLIRIISLLKMLCVAEPRLPKKLITPFRTVIDTTSSISVVIECTKAMLEIPISDTTLFTTATMKIESFLQHPEPNLRFLCLSLFVQIIKVQPKLVAKHKDLIAKSLESEDDSTRIIALDLLSAMANEKNIDSIVQKLYENFVDSKSLAFRNMILNRIITLCSSNDYQFITDFDWYLTCLFNIINDASFSSYDIVATQILDLVYRVPPTRSYIVQHLSIVFAKSEYRDADSLLLAASHTISEYSEDSQAFSGLLQPYIAHCSERVQASCIVSSFKLYLKAQNEEERTKIEKLYELRLPLFIQSPFVEVQDRASSIQNLMTMMKGEAKSEVYKTFADYKKSTEQIEPPEHLNDPIPLFAEEDNQLFEEEPQLKAEDSVAQEEPTPYIEEMKPKKPLKKKKHAPKIQKIVILDTESLFAKPSQQAKKHVISPELAAINLSEDSIPEPKPLIKDQPPQPIQKPHKKHHKKHHKKKDNELMNDM